MGTMVVSLPTRCPTRCADAAHADKHGLAPAGLGIGGWGLRWCHYPRAAHADKHGLAPAGLVVGGWGLWWCHYPCAAHADKHGSAPAGLGRGGCVGLEGRGGQLGMWGTWWRWGWSRGAAWLCLSACGAIAQRVGRVEVSYRM